MGEIDGMDISPTGVWRGALRRADAAEATDAVAELDALGYGAVWIAGFTGGPAAPPPRARVLQDGPACGASSGAAWRPR
jgi:hypothetical protein